MGGILKGTVCVCEDAELTHLAQHRVPLNFVVEWLIVLLRIRDVPGSNLGLAWRPVILTDVFRGFT
jgi:hypothetical protein